MMVKHSFTAMIVIGILLFQMQGSAQAQETFYQGRVMRILVGFTPGGGVDTTARLVARHIVDHIPGRPRVIVQNMPGAGGRIALSYLYNVAKDNGLTISVVPVSPALDQILDDKRKFDVSKLTYLAGSAEPGIVLIRAATGVKTPADLTKVDPAKLAIPGRAAPDTQQMYLKTALDLLGVTGGYKTSLGYRGTAQITTALLRGEASLYAWSLVNTLKGGIMYDPIREGKIIPLWQTGRMSSEGKVVRDSRVDLPTFDEVYKSVKGKQLEGVKADATRFLGPGLRSLNRGIIMRPGVPAQRVKILNQAFSDMIKSEKFDKALVRMTGFKWIWFDGKTAEQIRDDLLKGVDPKVLAQIKSVM